MAYRRNEIAARRRRKAKTACILSAAYCAVALVLAAPPPARADASTTISRDEVWAIYPDFGKVSVTITHVEGSHAGVKIVTTFNSLDGSGPILVPPVPVFVGVGQQSQIMLQRDGFIVQQVEFTGISGTATISVAYSGCCM